jgi:hypothetical protein
MLGKYAPASFIPFSLLVVVMPYLWHTEEPWALGRQVTGTPTTILAHQVSVLRVAFCRSVS